MSDLDLGTRRQLLPVDVIPCEVGLAWWLAQDDNATAWDSCLRGNWLLWIVGEAQLADDSTLRLIACDCAREVWHLLTDERSRTAVEVAERFARGEATREELDAAWAGAWAAACDATCDTARAAACDVARASAWSAAWDGAWDSAKAATEDGACDAAWERQAEIVRSRVPNPYRR